MTNKACDTAPAHGAGASSRYYPSNPRGGSSSEAGSGGSSCESHEDRSHERADLSQEDSDMESGMDTIKRNIKLKPHRPPRTIDSKSSHSSSEYYNLCHPPPLGEPVPALPRRAPYISHEGALLAQEKGVQGAQEPPASRSCDTLASRCGSRASEALNSEALNTLSLNRGAGLSLNMSQRQRLKNLNRRRKGSVCSCKHGNSGPERQDSVLLLYSRHCSGSVEWARYLHKLFTELSRNKSRLQVKHLPVEDLSCHLPTSMEADLFNARLQLVIVSPVFLQWVYRNPAQLVGRILQQDRVIALLLGVREEQVTPEHRSSLISFPQWVHLEARDHDLEFVQTVLYFSSQILQRTDHRAAPVSAESLAFTLFPRKVTEGQNKVVVMLDKPLTARSNIRLLVEKANGQRTTLEEMKMRNPYTLVVTLPVCLFSKSSLVNLYLEIDGESKGFRQLKCESKTHELDSLLATLCDPMEFLCQTMAISPYCKDQLDETLTSNLMANIPKHGFPLLSFSSGRDFNARGGRDHGELPTLLHFSAAHGLERLTCALLDCPGARHALTIRNAHNMTPIEVAKDNGYLDISEILSAHQHNPSKFSHIYDFVKHHDGGLSSPKVNRIKPHIKTPLAPQDRPQSATSGATDYSGPDPYNPFISNYQVPPPPRPVPSTPSKPNPYLDMSGDNSGTPSPCLQRRGTVPHDRLQKNRNPRTLNDLFQNCHTMSRTINQSSANSDSVATRAATLSKYNLDSTYQEIDSPKTVDPFGTLRASKLRRSLREKTPPVPERLYVNDPFGTMRAARANSVPKSFSSETSNDDVFVPETKEKCNRNDYRGVKDESVNSNNNLAVTNELLDLLEDFKKKSYSVKEMEIMFENWRRKASLPENLLKENTNCDKKAKNDSLLKTAKSAYSLLKMFKSSQTGDNSMKIGKTSNAKKFLKASSIEVVQISSDVNTVSEQIEIKTTPDQETLDESQLSVVALPPTPLKPSAAGDTRDSCKSASESPPEDSVSSQILPLHRLSASSLPAPSQAAHSALAQQVLTRNKPVAEVSPFSNNKNENDQEENSRLDDTYGGYQRVPNNSVNLEMSSLTPSMTPNCPNNTMTAIQETKEPVVVRRQTAPASAPANLENVGSKSPVKERLQRMRRSITEPLFQYFHDITLTSDHEEPDILNTPKSLIQLPEAGKKLSRKLFSPQEAEEARNEINKMSEETLRRHAAKTSQVNEYQNISPTPSTDL